MNQVAVQFIFPRMVALLLYLHTYRSLLMVDGAETSGASPSGDALPDAERTFPKAVWEAVLGRVASSRYVVHAPYKTSPYKTSPLWYLLPIPLST